MIALRFGVTQVSCLDLKWTCQLKNTFQLKKNLSKFCTNLNSDFKYVDFKIVRDCENTNRTDDKPKYIN